MASMASTTSSNGDTGYVYGGPASNLASEIRSIAFAPSALQGINSFIDQVLLSTLSNLPPAPAPAPASIISGPAASIALPLTTRAFKDALLAAFHGNTTFVRDAILEAELEQRDWVKSRGRSSDLALPPLSPSKRRPSVANQIPFVEKGPATYELKKQELQTCTVQDLFFELQTAIYQLSTLGHRAAFPHTPGSGAAAASNLKNRGYLTLLSPLLALYTSSVVNYLAAYLVKGCTKTVESIPDLSVADLSQFVEFMEEDALLNDLWKTIQTKSFSEQALPVSGSSDLLTYPTSLEDTLSSHNISSRTAQTDSSLTKYKMPVRRSSLGHNMNRSISSSNQKCLKDHLSASSSLSLASSLAEVSHFAGQRSQEERSVYPETAFVTISTNNPLSARSLRQHDSPLGISSKSDNKPHNYSRQSLSSAHSSNGLLYADEKDFDSLLRGDQTVKMSLTPSRFKFAGSESNSLSDPFSSSTESTHPDRLRARQARPAQGGKPSDDFLHIEQREDIVYHSSSGKEGLNGSRQKNKESLMDILNTEPPWAPSTSVMNELPPLPRSFSSPASPTQKKFSPIANIHAISGLDNNPPLTAPSGVLPSTAGSLEAFGIGADQKALNGLPVLPLHDAPILTSYRSVPDLAFESSFNNSSNSNNSAGARVKLIAKEERGNKMEKTSDLVAFLKNTPPPLPLHSSLPNTTRSNASMRSEPTTPTSTSAKSRLGGFKFRHILASATSRRPALPTKNPPISGEQLPTNEFGKLTRSASITRKLSQSPSFSNSRRGRSSSRSRGDGDSSVSEVEKLKVEISGEATTETLPLQKQGKDNDWVLVVENRSTVELPGTTSKLGVVIPLESNFSPPAPVSSPYPFFQHNPASPDIHAVHQPPIGIHEPVASASSSTVVPPLTPEHSKHDLYELSKKNAIISSHQSTFVRPLTHTSPSDTPPSTPSEKRSAYIAPLGSVSEERCILPMQQTYQAGVGVVNTQRRVSQIKRKAPPKAEEDVSVIASHKAGHLHYDRSESFPSSSAQMQREASSSSESGISAVMMMSRTRRRDPPSYAITSLSSSSPPSVSPYSPIRPRNRHHSISHMTALSAPQSFSTKGAPLSYTSSASATLGGGGVSLRELRHTLVNLQREMQSAASVEECLSLVDTALFELDEINSISSGHSGSSSIINDISMTSQSSLSQIDNRVYLALLECFLAEKLQV